MFMAQFRMLLPDDLLKRVDEARGDVPRVAWVRRACERALDETPPAARLGLLSSTGPPARPAAASTTGASRPAPAQTPYRQGWGPSVENLRSSDQAKRDVKPVPKTKGR